MPRPSVFSRRHMLGLACATLAVSGYAAWSYTHPESADGVVQVAVEVAHARAVTGDILLIDIRRPDEWSLTGVGEAALPLDMRRPDFLSALNQATGGDTSRAIALICARGVRSARLTRKLADAGYTRLINVPEGMLGSHAGAGWLAKGLPVIPAS